MKMNCDLLIEDLTRAGFAASEAEFLLGVGEPLVSDIIETLCELETAEREKLIAILRALAVFPGSDHRTQSAETMPMTGRTH